MQSYQTPSKLLAHVANFGFGRLVANGNQVNELVQFLQKRRFVVSNTSLQIKHASNARPNTLSAKYGSAGFPFHTDFAFRAMPPRYILLLNATNSVFHRPTLIARLDMLAPSLRNLVRSSVWKLVTLQKRYLVSGQFMRNGQVVWRWDCDFLAPVNKEAHEAFQSAPMAMGEIAQPIVWSGQSAVLIDNWNCVHARGEEQINAQEELSRTLTRYEFWGDARMVL